jgi:Zn-finger nucleic acid-binding protein
VDCPSCKSELLAKVEFGIALDECSACGGIWLEDGELQRILNSGAEITLGLEESVCPSGEIVTIRDLNRVCPKCSIHLDRYRYNYSSQIELDTCHQCNGVWVDDGELFAIKEFNQAEKEITAADGGKWLAGVTAMAEFEGEALEHRQRARRIIGGVRHVMTCRYGFYMPKDDFPMPASEVPSFVDPTK